MMSIDNNKKQLICSKIPEQIKILIINNKQLKVIAKV